MKSNDELERASLGVGIPPRPTVLSQLESEMKKDEPDLRQIEKLISADVGISAAMIKTVNSPFYGLASKVVSVRQAVNLLGLLAVTRIVTGMALRNVAPGLNALELEKFLEDSAQVALVSSYMAGLMSGVDKDQAFTFGLFQNAGVLLLMSGLPGYRKTWELANSSQVKGLVQIEQEQHRVTHTYIGYLMAKDWGLPEPIAEAIHHHHDYEALSGSGKDLPAQSRDLIALALLAERVLHAESGFERTADWVVGGAIALDHFSLTESGFQDLAATVLTLRQAGV